MLKTLAHKLHVVAGLKSSDGEIEVTTEQKVFYYTYYGVVITVVALLGKIALGF